MAMLGHPTTSPTPSRRAPESHSPASSSWSRRAQAARDEKTKRTGWARRRRPSLQRSLQRSSGEESNESSESDVAPAERWFERSNQNVGQLGPQFVDDDPPYFLQNQSSTSGQRGPETARLGRSASGRGRTASQVVPELAHTGSNGSSSGEFRGVIDDLTIENKRLKKRLRRYETPHTTPLDKDRLFEVKIHGLSPRKKRELEATLHAFAASISRDASTPPRSASLHPPDAAPRYGAKKLSSSSASNSQLVDSAYASASRSGPRSTQQSHHLGSERRPPPPRDGAPPGPAPAVLEEIPPGLLPQHSAGMTERAKQKLVVRRLEQLFTGRIRIAGGPHRHQLQQQEVSQSAARDDRLASAGRGLPVSAAEGVREANIIPIEMALGKALLPPLRGDSSGRSSRTSQAEGDRERGPDAPDSPDQRPTRPLDLDPDRAQVPADNMEYIRHLGVSTPLMEVEDSLDAAADDAHGWVYLNLLISMAQLHIINVTPDFVRSALADLSTRFQLSPDGRKIRWTGGMEGTELSSDSGADGAVQRSPAGSDGHEAREKKRRKLDPWASQTLTLEQMVERRQPSAAPLPAGGDGWPAQNHERLNALRYKPLFAHQSGTESYGMSVDDSISQRSYVSADESDSGLMSGTRRAMAAAARGSPSRSSSRRKRSQGAIVFYTGASFCTDLCGDRDDISTPLYVTHVGVDGFSNHTHDALGCKPTSAARLTPSRTLSGSVIPVRPSQEDTISARPLRDARARSRTPELVRREGTPGLHFSSAWPATGPREGGAPRSFDACGLGGTRPADHFAVTVETRRTMLSGTARAQVQRQAIQKRSRILCFLDNPSAASLDPSHFPGAHERANPLELPFQTEILSTHIQHLDPSELPPPATYHRAFSSSTDGSEATSDDEGEEVPEMQQRLRFLQRALHPAPGSELGADVKQGADNCSVDDSINMLAWDRAAPPWKESSGASVDGADWISSSSDAPMPEE